MCGIAGLVRLDGAPVGEAVLERMATALAHRGPDGAGIFLDGEVGLAHRRLAIIDPEGGHQPLRDAAAGVSLSYNGEVYNYREIRQQLSAEVFRTRSDTEVVLRAYQRWGIGCLERFRGMFAFALLDRPAAKLYLVRDRLGIKPLFYARVGTQLVFASELGGLLASGQVPREIDPEGLAGYLRLQCVPTPVSIYRGVRKLAPGCFLELDLRSGQQRIERYWDVAAGAPPRSEANALEALDERLDETVRIYLRSDVPFGAFLSGGVDSSLVTAWMGRHLSEPVRTFSIGFQESQHSELQYASEVAERCKTRHREIVVSPRMSEAVLRGIARSCGEPFGDSSAIPTWFVSQAAAEEVKMVLSGDGGDELFAGYDSYPRVQERMEEPLGALRRAFFAGLARLAPSARLRRGARGRSLAPEALHDSLREIFPEAEVRRLLGRSVPRPDPPRLRADPITRLQYRDLKTYLVDDILTKVDRMSMAHSLEVRVPLLDHVLVELAFSLPPGLRLRRHDGRWVTKYLLKQAAGRFFEASFLERPKRGFGIPVVEWLRDDLRPLVHDALGRGDHPLYDHVDRSEVRACHAAFERGEVGRAPRLWCLLMLALWLEEVDARAPGAAP